MQSSVFVQVVSLYPHIPTTIECRARPKKESTSLSEYRSDQWKFLPNIFFGLLSLNLSLSQLFISVSSISIYRRKHIKGEWASRCVPFLDKGTFLPAYRPAVSE